MVKAISLAGKRIRLFFHTDLDGVIAADLIKLFSGANISELVPCPRQNFKKPPKKDSNVTDVFVDCRAQDKDEDIRIDHHAAGEDEAYLKKESIIVDAKYQSAVTLVADVLGIQDKVIKQVLDEMDKVDSGKPNIFAKFATDNTSFTKILFNPGFSAADYLDFEQFKDKLLGCMVKGFAIEDIKELSAYEKEMVQKYKVIIEEIKKAGAPLVKFVHTPVEEGTFLESVFKMTDSDFFGKVNPYVRQHYFEESKKSNMCIYVVAGFRAYNFEFNETCTQIMKDTHPEPYQIFVSRGPGNGSINIGKLIQDVKQKTGIKNGGGRDDVGGINTADKNAAITALGLIIDYIRNNAP